MRFTDFLKATVLLSAGCASVLAALTLAGAAADDDEPTVLVVGLAWWLSAAVAGAWLGRRAEVAPPIRDLLVKARAATALPESTPGRILLERLWPLLLPSLIAGAIAWLFPQVPMAAAGFAIIWALYWRRQERAVTAIEERDGVAFFVEPSSAFSPIQLVRAPAFKRELRMLDGQGA